MKILKDNMHFVPVLDQKFKTTVFHVTENMSSNAIYLQIVLHAYLIIITLL